MSDIPEGTREQVSGQPADAEDIDDKVVDATLNAYYPAIVASADSARARSQAAYTVASGTAAALAAAGLVVDIDTYPRQVQIVGVLALLAWMTSAALFMRVSTAVRSTKPKPPPAAPTGQTETAVRSAKSKPPPAAPPGQPEMLDAKTFTVRALSSAWAATRVIEGRLVLAIRAVYVALALTLIVFASALVFPAQKTVKDVVLDLTPAGQVSIEKACAADPAFIRGKVQVSTLKEAWTVIKVGAGTCGKKPEIMVVPTKDISAVEQRGKFPFFSD